MVRLPRRQSLLSCRSKSNEERGRAGTFVNDRCESKDQNVRRKGQPRLTDRCPAWLRALLGSVDAVTLRWLVILGCAAFWIAVVYLVLV